MSRRADNPARGRKTPEAGAAEAGLPWRPIRVVHLSDLHFDERSAWDAGTVLDRLAQDVSKLRQELGEIDLVVVTGDIANKGRASEYAMALHWLDGPLREAAGVERSRIRVVPGNHEVDRGRWLPPRSPHPGPGALNMASISSIAEPGIGLHGTESSICLRPRWCMPTIGAGTSWRSESMRRIVSVYGGNECPRV